jgi:hypothetical protein
MQFSKDYVNELQRRRKRSHVYRKYQLLGLEIAGVLEDMNHKSLYIKLAKEAGGERLLQLAKEVAEKKNIHNKGAYFMSCLATRKVSKKNETIT